MTEDIKINDGQLGNGGQAQEENPSSRSELRIKDLNDKLKDQEGRHSLEKEEILKEKARLEAELQETRFEMDLTKEAQKYPFAPEFKSEIKSYTDKGLSVSEAATLVLTQKGKLSTPKDIDKTRQEPQSFGGSSLVTPTNNESDSSKMDQAQRRAALEQLEQEGRFAIKDGGLYIN